MAKCLYSYRDDLPENWAKPLPKHAKSPLQVDVSRSKMSFLKLLIVFCIASFGHRIICSTEKL